MDFARKLAREFLMWAQDPTKIMQGKLRFSDLFNLGSAPEKRGKRSKQKGKR